MHRAVDIEKEFDRLLPAVGGQRVSDLLGHAPGIANADYVFEQAGVVAELKCLQDNKLEDTRLNEKLWNLYRSWRKQGYAVSASHDGWRATIHNLPQECSQQVLEVYVKSIRNRVVKANKQIKQTRANLNRPTFKGLLLLANDGNLALDPEHIRHTLAWILRADYSAIDTVVFFTVNMSGRASFTNVDTLVWANLHRREHSGVDHGFLERLAGAWINHLEGLLGSQIAKFRLGSPDDLAKIRNIEPTPEPAGADALARSAQRRC